MILSHRHDPKPCGKELNAKKLEPLQLRQRVREHNLTEMHANNMLEHMDSTPVDGKVGGMGVRQTIS
jgi:hypothetical protein